jgi:hypothetical protein
MPSHGTTRRHDAHRHQSAQNGPTTALGTRPGRSNHPTHAFTRNCCKTAAVGHEIEILVENRWWLGCGKRQRADQEHPELRYRYVGHSKKSYGKWIGVSEPNVRLVTTEENKWQHYIANFKWQPQCRPAASVSQTSEYRDCPVW